MSFSKEESMKRSFTVLCATILTVFVLALIVGAGTDCPLSYSILFAFSQWPTPGDGGGVNTAQWPTPGDGGGGNIAQWPTPGDGGGGNIAQWPTPGDGGGGNIAQWPT